MTAQTLASSLIAEGANPNAAFAKAHARFPDQTFDSIRDEYRRRDKARRGAFVHKDSDVQAVRQEWDRWQVGETQTGAERNYYRR